MKKKWIKNAVIVGVLIAVVASSIKVRNLDEVRAMADEGKFDAKAYARDFWDNELMPNLCAAVEFNHLLSLLESDPQQAFENYSEALGIGNIRFFMIRGEGEIRKVGQDDITVVIQTDSGNQVLEIETEYIFGNAVRDASGQVDLEMFEQTMDFNNVSAEINQLIREEVLPELKSNAAVGKKISFVGAIEMNKEQVDLKNLEVIPVSIHIHSSKKESNDAEG